MATVKKTITFTENQNDWITFQITNGGYASESDYIGELIRRDQNQNAEFLTTKAAIEHGFKSGISEMNVSEIMKEVEDMMRKDGRL
ncbi:MAG: hypothetical protein WD426_20735 [Anditalea sp.]